MTRFLCFGDLHLGAGSDLGRQPDDRLNDQAAVLDQIADLARSYHVDAILNGGDTFDGPTIWPEQEDVYARFVARCRTNDIPIVQAVGNGRHDLAKRRRNALSIFQHIPGVDIYDRPDFRLIDADTAVCVLPWAPVDRLVAAQAGGDRAQINADAAEHLMSIARGLRDNACDAGATRTVLLLHWSISGASLPNGMPVDAYASEPILPVDELEQLGYDAIVASHIHRPQLLGSVIVGGVEPQPNVPLHNFPVLYTGSPMPLNFGETSHEHGVWIVDLDSAPEQFEPQFVPVESRRLVTGHADLTHDHGGEACLDETDEVVASLDLPLTDTVVRFKIRATDDQARRIDWPRIRAFLDDCGVHKLAGVVVDLDRVSRARVDEAADTDLSLLQVVDMWCAAEQLDPGVRDQLRALTLELQEAA